LMEMGGSVLACAPDHPLVRNPSTVAILPVSVGSVIRIDPVDTTSPSQRRRLCPRPSDARRHYERCRLRPASSNPLINSGHVGTRPVSIFDHTWCSFNVTSKAPELSRLCEIVLPIIQTRNTDEIWLSRACRINGGVATLSAANTGSPMRISAIAAMYDSVTSCEINGHGCGGT
jgi:hypothetical protein